MRPMGTVPYRGKGQGKGKGRGEGRLGQGGRGRSKGGEKLMGTTAYGGKGSKGRAANGDRPVGAASCRRDHHTMASCQNPPPPPPKVTQNGDEERASDLGGWAQFFHTQQPIQRMRQSTSLSEGPRASLGCRVAMAAPLGTCSCPNAASGPREPAQNVESKMGRNLDTKPKNCQWQTLSKLEQCLFHAFNRILQIPRAKILV